MKKELTKIKVSPKNNMNIEGKLFLVKKNIDYAKVTGNKGNTF